MLAGEDEREEKERTMKKLLIANRGEIAIRIARAAGEIGVAAVTIYAEDDSQSAHVAQGDEAIALQGRGAAAYLDIEFTPGTVFSARTLHLLAPLKPQA
jgi:pyruvate carboxylase